jgi:hypothetical protein
VFGGTALLDAPPLSVIERLQRYPKVELAAIAGMLSVVNVLGGYALRT